MITVRPEVVDIQCQEMFANTCTRSMYAVLGYCRYNTSCSFD